MPELISVDSVKIEKVVIHFLDLDGTEPVLSNYPTALDDDSEEYLKAHIVKAYNSDDIKKCAFERGGFVSSRVADVRHEFIDFSQELARRFFGVMQDAGSIPSGDLIVLTAEIAGEDHLAVMKLNYKTSFIHEFRAIADTNAINFVKHQGILPGKNAKIDEAFRSGKHVIAQAVGPCGYGDPADTGVIQCRIVAFSQDIHRSVSVRE